MIGAVFILVASALIVVGVARFGVLGLINKTESVLRAGVERITYGPKGSAKTQIADLPKPDYAKIVALEKGLGWEPLPEHVRQAGQRVPPLAPDFEIIENATKRLRAANARRPTPRTKVHKERARLRTLLNSGEVVIPGDTVRGLALSTDTALRFIENAKCADPDCPYWESYDMEDGTGGVLDTYRHHRPHPPRKPNGSHG